MHNQELNLPAFNYRFKTVAGAAHMYDEFRRKFVLITPEEWVRQHLLHHLVRDLGFPMQHVSVEKKLWVEGQPRRYDAVVYNNQFEPLMLIECKAPQVSIGQGVFDQAARYNRSLQVPYFLVSNGLMHVLAKIDYEQARYLYAAELLSYQALNGN
jgi:hypothetical protein